nr:unnamed protein product [Callosobruchus chinensis]
MTRFARAKGSKASNEKLPEEPTSWSIMKQQLLEKTKNIEENQNYLKIKNQRNASYQKFLAEREAEDNKNVKWADFPGGGASETSENNKDKKLKKVPKRTATSELSDDDSDEEFLELKAKIDKVLEEQQKGSESDEAPEEHSSKIETKPPVVPKAKKVKAKKLKIVSNKESKVMAKKEQAIQSMGHGEESKSSGKINIANSMVDVTNGAKKNKKLINTEDKTSIAGNSLNNEEGLSEASLKKVQKKKERRIKQIKKKKALKLLKQNDNNKSNVDNGDKGDMIQSKKESIKNQDKSDISEEELKKIQKKKEKKLKQLEKRKLKKKMEKERKEAEGKEDAQKNKDHGTSNNINISSSKSKSPNKEKKEYEPKKRKDRSTDNEQQRKKPHLPEKMWINGEQVEIGYVDGFPIMKKDAERLKQLKKDMVMKGLPGSEIKAALKLERRRAEKALAREKKKVCFNCRKSGHNLSECPELGKDQIISTAGSGICFKCGSTEHSHLDCKVVKGQTFNYAQCFICGEQGHIARQCPDNPKGLYPKGGGCNVCGDVSHLKKDCPTYQEQQQHQNEAFKLGTLGTSNPDADDEHNITHKVQMSNSHRPNKIIKF